MTFLSCDWGTSSFRLRVVDTNKITVLAATTSREGIAAFFEVWSQSGRKEESRISFYQSFIAEQVKKLEEQLRTSLQGVTMVISGMASSRIGMTELPYKQLPIATDGHDLLVKKMEATGDFDHPLLIISGVRTGNDIMRGEETQLIGSRIADKGEQIFVFPGTHSKHVSVLNGQALGIKTYMTGEFFELLSKKSILAGNVEESQEELQDDFLQSFESGTRDGLHLNLLHGSFLTRSNHLLGRYSPKENYYYLSGLLIGAEIKDLKQTAASIVLVCNKKIQQLYLAAFRTLGFENISIQDADEALIRGQHAVYNIHFF